MPKLILGVIVVGTLFLSGTGRTAIAIRPLEDRISAAEQIVVGTITYVKAEGAWFLGHVTVTRALKGGSKEGERILVRWKSPPPPPDPGKPRLADYTFRPQLDVPQIVLLFPRKEGEPRPTLNWGSTEGVENEKSVIAAITGPPAPAAEKGEKVGR